MNRRAVGTGVVLGLVIFGGSGLADDATPTHSRGRQQLHQLEIPPSLRGGATARKSLEDRDPDYSAFQILNILGRWWMPQLGDGGHMSTADSSEIPPYANSRFQGQMFYIPAGDDSSTFPLYRLSSVPLADHMDSLLTNELGYTLEGGLGYPFTSQEPGTQLIRRWFKPSGPHDHMTARSGETIPDGYNQDAELGFGYPRYPVGLGQHCTENFTTVHSPEVDMVFSKVAGGTVWELSWNGKQFVNDWEYGRQIQTAFFWTPGDVHNPNEGGDTSEAGPLSQCEVLGAWAHGSPLLSYNVVSAGLDGSGPIVTTKTKPLNWDPKPFVCPDPQQPCDPDHPVVWKGTIEKEVTLNFQNHPKRIRWKVTMTVPSTIVCPPEQGDCVLVEITSGHVTSDFNELYAFDATLGVGMGLSDDKMDDILSLPGDEICIWAFDDPDLRPHVGGMIASTSDKKYALGIYHNEADFSNEKAFHLCAVTGYASDEQYGINTSKWGLLRYLNGIEAGAHSFTSYIVVGTLDAVQQEMVDMYEQGL